MLDELPNLSETGEFADSPKTDELLDSFESEKLLSDSVEKTDLFETDLLPVIFFLIFYFDFQFIRRLIFICHNVKICLNIN